MAPGSPPSQWFDNPPASDGRMVVISDTDHYAPGQGDGLWAWKSFLRGHYPILMDFGIIDGVTPHAPSPGTPPYGASEGARYAMGDTLRCAERVNLMDMKPMGELSSTGYVLGNPGEEYLVLQPSEKADPFTVTLDTGTYLVEWFNVNSRQTENAGEMIVEVEGRFSFTAPFAEKGPAVLYLKRVRH